MDSIFNMMDDDMKQEYLKGNLKFSRGKVVVGDVEIALLELNKGEVMACNFNRILSQMKKNEKNPKMNKGFASLSLMIQGWDHVPEPIYEIKEIRRFYMRLYQKIPHFLFYIAPLNQIPMYILASLADIKVRERHGNFIAPLALIQKEGSTKNIGSTTIEVKLSGEIGYRMIDAIREHAEKIEFEDKKKELPVLYRFIENSIKKEERLNKYQNK